MKPFTQHSITVIGLTFAVAIMSGTTYAGDNIRADALILKAGWHHHDRHYRKKHHRRKYRPHSRRHSHRHHNHYYNDYRPRDYRYHSDRYYKKRHYYGNDYHGRRYGKPRRHRDYDRPSVHAEACPLPGYSADYYRNRDGYRHKGHYHYDD